MDESKAGEGEEGVRERAQFAQRIVELAQKAEAAWDQGEIASSLLVAHITYAEGFMARQDIAASLRAVADQLGATPPALPPELLQ